MRLNELWPGFYSMDGGPVQTEENLVVSVHPFYKFHGFTGLNMPDEAYLRRMKEFLTFREGAVVTLEEGFSLGETVECYKRLGSFSNRFFIKTHPANPNPLELDWEDVTIYLEKMRQDRPIEVMGGYFTSLPNSLTRSDRMNPWGNPPETWDGCLGHTSKKLREKVKDRKFMHEGICEECGNTDILYRVHGMLICESCKNSI